MKPAYFISDAHLGIPIPGGEGREEALLSFFREEVSGASHLFIVGDLFDFWIEYRHAIRPDYFRVLHGLRSLVEAGVEVHYCQGNHDFALGPFISETVGITVHPDRFRGSLQGRNLVVCHGDGLRRGDWSGRLLSRLLRNRGNQGLYRLLHPTLGVPLGEMISGVSRRRELARADEADLAAYRAAAEKILQAGADLVILGHTHYPELRNFPGGSYCNTGNWFRRFSCVLLRDGEAELNEYLPGQGLVPWEDADDGN